MIAAEGEQKASHALRDAAEIISQSPSAIQLRYLQVSISPNEDHRDHSYPMRIIEIIVIRVERKWSKYHSQYKIEHFGLMLSYDIMKDDNTYFCLHNSLSFSADVKRSLLKGLFR